MSASGLSAVAVIPAYNEASSIRDVVTRTLSVIDKVIVVDDGSHDGTSAQLSGLPIVLLQNATNQGKSLSLVIGMKQAMVDGYDAVITLDGDGQHLPEDIPKFLQMAREYPGYILIGARLANKADFPPLRYYANRFANFWISWAAHHAIADSQSGFRLYPAAIIENFALRLMAKSSFVFESEILIEAGRAGVYTKSLPISAIYFPHARKSHFHPAWDFLRIARMIAWKLLKRGMDPVGFYRMQNPRKNFNAGKWKD